MSFQNWFRLSVCTTIFKRIAGPCFYPKSLLLYVHQWIRLDEQWEACFKFQIHVRVISRKPKNITRNSEAWILIKVQCVIYQWIQLDKLYKLMESFFQISISFLNFDRKPNFFQKNREAWMVTKLQCVIYLSIRPNELYKLIESFIQILN